eukprot:4709312-Amphidinium_carterae.1
MSPLGSTDCTQYLRAAYNHTRPFSLGHSVKQFCRIAAGLLTSLGLDFLAGMLCGPNVDRATLQLIGQWLKVERKRPKQFSRNLAERIIAVCLRNTSCSSSAH